MTMSLVFYHIQVKDVFDELALFDNTTAISSHSKERYA
jgi:hypothetical protein